MPPVILMTDDVANRQKAEKEGIKCISGAFMNDHCAEIPLITVVVRKYVESLENDSAQLLDLLSATSGDDIEPTRAQATSRQVLYPDVRSFYLFIFRPTSFSFWIQYLPMSTLVAGVKAGQLHQGHFNANQYNYLEARFRHVERYFLN